MTQCLAMAEALQTCVKGVRTSGKGRRLRVVSASTANEAEVGTTNVATDTQQVLAKPHR